MIIVRVKNGANKLEIGNVVIILVADNKRDTMWLIQLQYLLVNNNILDTF